MSPETATALIVFLQGLVEDLSKEGPQATSAERALIEAQQYPFLKYTLESNLQKLIAARARGEGEFKNALREVFNNALKLITTQATAFQSQAPETPLTPREVAQRAVYWQRANEKEKVVVATQEKTIEQLRKEYPQQLVRAWVQKLRDRRLEINASTLAHELERNIKDVGPDLPPAQLGKVIEQRVVEVVGRYPESQRALAENPTAFQEALATTSPLRDKLTTAAVQNYRTRQVVAQAILTHRDLVRPDNLVEIITGGLTDPTIDVTKLQEKAVKLTQIAEALSSPPLPAGEDITATGRVWTSLATTWYQKAAAALLDPVFTAFPRQVRETIVDNVFLRSWEPTVQKLEQRFGQFVVRSPGFQKLLSAHEALGRERAAATGVISGVSKITNDVVGAVFRGPNEAMIAYYETYVLTRGTILTQAALTPGHLTAASVHRSFPQLFHLEFLENLGGLALRLGAKKTAEGAIRAGAVGAAEGAAAKGLLSRVFGFIFGRAGAAAGGGAAGAAAGAPAGLVGAILGFIGGSLVEPVLRGAGKVASWLFAGGWLTSLTGMGEGAQDKSWIAPLIMVALLSVFLVFPLISPLNFFHVGELSRTSPLPLSLGGGEASGGPAVNCSINTQDPLCKFEPCRGDCRWPTTGYISQGPYATCSSASHHSLNAIDFAASYLTTVYATRRGEITKVYAECGDNTGYWGNHCGNGYGNHVIITTDEGYRLIYGHLSQNFLDNLRPGMRVNPGDPIGKVDHNGNSSGSHLHFGVLGSSPNINAVIPSDFGPIVGCSNNTRGCDSCNYPVVHAGGG